MQLPLAVECDKVFQYPGYGPHLGRVLHTYISLYTCYGIGIPGSDYIIIFYDTIMPHSGLGIVVRQHLSTHTPTGDSGQQWDAALDGKNTNARLAALPLY